MEGGARPYALRFGPDPPPMRLHDAPADVEAKSEPLALGRSALLEPGEDALQQGRRNPDPLVSHREMQLMIRLGEGDGHLTAARVSNSIAEQVCHDLPHASRIARPDQDRWRLDQELMGVAGGPHVLYRL